MIKIYGIVRNIKNIKDKIVLKKKDIKDIESKRILCFAENDIEVEQYRRGLRAVVNRCHGELQMVSLKKNESVLFVLYLGKSKNYREISVKKDIKYMKMMFREANEKKMKHIFSNLVSMNVHYDCLFDSLNTALFPNLYVYIEPAYEYTNPYGNGEYYQKYVMGFEHVEKHHDCVRELALEIEDKLNFHVEVGNTFGNKNPNYYLFHVYTDMNKDDAIAELSKLLKEPYICFKKRI